MAIKNSAKTTKRKTIAIENSAKPTKRKTIAIGNNSKGIGNSGAAMQLNLGQRAHYRFKYISCGKVNKGGGLSIAFFKYVTTEDAEDTEKKI